MIENRVRQAVMDVRVSKGLTIIGEHRSTSDMSRGSGGLSKITHIAVGELDKSPNTWNDYVSAQSFHGSSGEINVQTHTSYHIEEGSGVVVEVVIFNSRVYAEKVDNDLRQNNLWELDAVGHKKMRK